MASLPVWWAVVVVGESRVLEGVAAPWAALLVVAVWWALAVSLAGWSVGSFMIGSVAALIVVAVPGGFMVAAFSLHGWRARRARSRVERVVITVLALAVSGAAWACAHHGGGLGALTAGLLLWLPALLPVDDSLAFRLRESSLQAGGAMASLLTKALGIRRRMVQAPAGWPPAAVTLVSRGLARVAHAAAQQRDADPRTAEAWEAHTALLVHRLDALALACERRLALVDRMGDASAVLAADKLDALQSELAALEDLDQAGAVHGRAA